MLLLTCCDGSIDMNLLPDGGTVPITMLVKEDRISTRAPVTAANLDASKVGIYGVPESNTSGVFSWASTLPLLNLSPATYSSSDGQITFLPKVYYPDGGRRLKFYAYHPKTTAASGNNYITAPGNGIAPVFNFTLTGQEDVMYATSTPYGSNTAGIPTLTFSHKLTQIILDTSLLGLLQSVRLVGVKNKGSMDLGTGVVTYSSSVINIPLTVSGLKTVPVMVPADIDKYRVDITTLVLTLTYYIRPVSGNFLPGRIYTIQLPLL